VTSATAKLARLVHGDDAWELMGRRIVIGRDATADIQISDTTVSREHAALVKRGTAWWVVDLGSTNGTAVNGVAAAEHPLSAGDLITFGEAEVEFLEG
jgi:pSer/pThr/pTyr-binding forkhead associated (FHA) protein